MGVQLGNIEVRHTTRSIQEAKRKIRQKIDQVKDQLKKCEMFPSTQPWNEMRRVVTSVKELRSPFGTLKEALQNDLRVLQAKLRDLDREAERLRNRAANQARRDFNQEYKETLTRAEKRGSLTEKELAELRAKAEAVLLKYVNILDGSPSEKNIKHVLESIEAPLTLGSNLMHGPGARAIEALRRASEKLTDQHEKVFRKNPTAEKFAKMLSVKALALSLSGKIQNKPSGWKPAHTTHEVVPGDTLSEISKHYYGSAGYWDIIFMENIGVIGDDADKLTMGVTLTIP